LYPLPASLLLLPLAPLPELAARVSFVGLSGALLAYALTREGFERLLLLASTSYLGAAIAAQWSPLLTAAFLMPALAWVLPAKPNIGLAMSVAAPTRRVPVVAAASALVLLAASFVLQPHWLGEWLRAIRGTEHLRAPITAPGGLLVLLALTRWRRADARLLLAMACVPQTTLVYELLPLGLIMRGRRQLVLFVTLTLAFQLLGKALSSSTDTFSDQAKLGGALMVALLYLPALLIVLRRPNVGAIPERLERAVAAVHLRITRLRAAGG
jgi:hypothetical protein